jgi:hypothetical protein
MGGSSGDPSRRGLGRQAGSCHPLPATLWRFLHSHLRKIATLLGNIRNWRIVLKSSAIDRASPR